MSVELPDRPRLVSWARLRLDPQSGQHVLLYPEKGLVLNETSLQIVQRCTGVHTAAQIAATLADEHPAADAAQIARDTHHFIAELAKRGLLERSA